MKLRWSNGYNRAHEFEAGESLESIAFAVGTSLREAVRDTGPELQLHLWDTFGSEPQWVAVTSTRGFPLLVKPGAEWSPTHDDEIAKRVLAVMEHSRKLAALVRDIGYVVSDDSLTTREAAALLGVNPSRIRGLVLEGRLAAETEETPRGPILRVSRESVEEYQRTRRPYTKKDGDPQ